MTVNVLICDDDPFLLELVSFRLNLEGFSVKAVENGAEALTALETFEPDIVVLDSMMPGMDGLEVLKRIRILPEHAHTPIVMLSARNRQQDIVNSLREGAADYIVKPFIPDELCVRIEKQLKIQSVKAAAA